MRRPGEDKMTEMIKQKLESYQPAYNPDGWRNFSSQFEVKRPINVAFKYWLLGLITGLLLLTGISYLWKRDKADHNAVQQLAKEVYSLRQEINSLKTTHTYSHPLNRNSIKKTDNNDVYNSDQNQSGYKPIIQHQYVFIELPNRKQQESKHNYSTQAEDLKYLSPLHFQSIYSYLLTTDSLNYTNKYSLDQTSTKKRKRNSFNLLDLFSPSLQNNTYNKFTGPDRIFASSNMGFEPMTNGKNTIAIGGGIGASGAISNRMRVYAGINYITNNWNYNTAYTHMDSIAKNDSIYKSIIQDSTITNLYNSQHLQIPINISYTLLKTNRSTFGIMGGISSRIYLKEEYQIINNTPNMPTIVKENSHRKFDHIHFASNLNFGFNYEFAFRNKWVIQAQPYYNIGLKNVSELKLKNNSFGINLNIGYSIQ